MKVTYEFAVEISAPYGKFTGMVPYRRDDPPEVAESDARRVSQEQVMSLARKIHDLLGGVASDWDDVKVRLARHIEEFG